MKPTERKLQTIQPTQPSYASHNLIKSRREISKLNVIKFIQMHSDPTV